MSHTSTFGSLYLHICWTGISSSCPTSSVDDDMDVDMGCDGVVGDDGSGNDDDPRAVVGLVGNVVVVGPFQRIGGNSVLGDVTSMFMGAECDGDGGNGGRTEDGW